MAQGYRPVIRNPNQGEQGEKMVETLTVTREEINAMITSAVVKALEDRKPDQPSPQPALTAETLAAAFAKAGQRENTQAPMVSVYNPYGDNVKPRPDLRCKTYLNGIALDKDTLTWEEIEALNALPPGEFKVSKANGQRIPFKVRYTRTADEETLEKVDVEFPCKEEHRYDHRGLLEYCFDVLEQAGKSEDVGRLTNLRKELNALRK